jgi:hypothetical protein
MRQLICFGKMFVESNLTTTVVESDGHFCEAAEFVDQEADNSRNHNGFIIIFF